MTTLLILWLTWCALNLLLMAIVTPKVPAYTGFKIVMPESLKSRLTAEEFRAVFIHELGHQHHQHVWHNYARVCVFWFPSKERLHRQELEADDYAAGQGCAEELASALRKMATSRVDMQRAMRLEVKV